MRRKIFFGEEKRKKSFGKEKYLFVGENKNREGKREKENIFLRRTKGKVHEIKK